MALDHLDELTLQALEESMWRPETRFDHAYMDAILAPGYVEIGQSGRVWSRDDEVGLEPVEIDVRLPLTGFSASELAPGVAHVRYTSEPVHGSRGAALRSSIWVRTDRWRLVFHQATPTAI
ncbi:nuclear transport factor 2 family protein [Demequina subtropica]|uniref:nuclear transport factor 2 family protein n=1 Tax=Demequina subtropica TaxID=1638989 RepID=UPI000785F26E|nr:DUF4440 domain-containing protein [Demequina subtropica]